MVVDEDLARYKFFFELLILRTESYTSATIHWKAVELNCFFFQLHPVCNSEKFISFGLGTVMSERIKEEFAHELVLSCLYEVLRASAYDIYLIVCQWSTLSKQKASVSHSLQPGGSNT